jgi:dUTP pyrophosphatase
MTFCENKYKLNIKLNNADTRIFDYYNKFVSHHNGDSGIDLINVRSLEIFPLEIGTIDFQIQCEMIDLETNNLVSYYLVPRSSISKTNLMMANSIGIIDAGYRGNILAKVRNMNLNDVQIVGRDDCLFQIVAPDLKPIKLSIVDRLSNTTRDSSGFGSTDN